MSPQFQEVFDLLSGILRETAPEMTVTGEGTPALTLMTTWIEARTRRPAWFAQVAIKKSYVSFHLIPLDGLPALREAIPPGLEKHRQGKSCFNFKTPSPAAFEELRQLIRLAVEMDPDRRSALGA
jgi:hypothetical protein